MAQDLDVYVSRTRRDAWSACVKCIRMSGFGLVLLGSLCSVSSPWLCTCLELSYMLVFSLMLDAPFWRALGHDEFSFTHDIEDVIVLSILRCFVGACVYSACCFLTPIPRSYSVASYLLAVLTIPYAIIKVSFFHFSNAWPFEALIIGGCAVWPVLHCLVSEHVLRQALKRHHLGLDLWPSPNVSSPSSSQLLDTPRLSYVEQPSPLQHPLLGVVCTDELTECAADEPLLGADLRESDPESRFIRFGDVRMHYKVVNPHPDMHVGGKAVVLIHECGGSTVSWRNVAQSLASRCGCRVIVLDRPPFGLTTVSLPEPPHQGPPPRAFTLEAQGQLVAALAQRLRISDLILAGHGDGAAIALYAACYTVTATPPPSSAESAFGAPRGGRNAPPTFCGTSIPARLPRKLSQKGARDTTAPRMQLSRSAPVDFLLVAQDASARSAASAPSSPPSSASLQPCAATARPQSHQQQHHTGAHDDGGSTALKAALRLTSHDEAQSSRSDSGVIAAARSGGGDATDPASREEEGVTSSSGPRSFLVPLASLLESHPSMAGESSSDGGDSRHGSQHGSDAAAATTTHTQRAPPPHDAPTQRCGQHDKDVGSSEHAHALQSGARDDRSAGGETAAATTTHSGVQLRGILLLHPCLEGEGSASSLAGLLGSSRVGRHILRSMLKVEVGEVFNRRAWHNPKHLTPGVLELYSRPLRARGWDPALITACCQKRDSASAGKWCQVKRAFGAMCPSLVVTGMHDVILTPAKAGCLAYQLGCGMALLPECGHLSNEEAVPQLLDALVPFIRSALP